MSYKHFNAVKQHLHRQDSQMGTVRKKVPLINDAFGVMWPQGGSRSFIMLLLVLLSPSVLFR